MTSAELVLSAPTNLRDLGGIPTALGPVRPGVAIRADDLTLITPEVATSLVDDGLTAVIDLRTPQEFQVTGRGPLADQPVAYHHLPLMARFPDRDSPLVSPRTAAEMGVGYADMFSTAAAPLVSALALIGINRGTTAFHCSAGKDRTGVLAAALLLTLDADDQAIVDDYSATGPNVASIMARLDQTVGAMFAGMGLDLDKVSAAARGTDFSGEAMESMLYTLRARHGDPLQPLRDAGLTDGLVAALRARSVGGRTA